MKSALPLRIAVTGTSGTGKTTLALALSKALDLPFLEEGYDGRITRRKGKTVAEWEAELFAVFDRKIGEEARRESFVADRCAIDLFCAWFNNNLHVRCDPTITRRFLGRCAQAARRYHFVVVTPWNALPFVEREPDRPGMRRNPNPWVRLRIHATTLGLAHFLLDKRRILELPGKPMSVEERTAWLTAAIERRLALLNPTNS
ncbi:MAG: hypothetical protein KatS3mg124_0478 [Porticoccaceae bacterium]|nr:MAG: hypothetical protein KatS3mg124_0478 [Porticoccaceae bacterium]